MSDKLGFSQLQTNGWHYGGKLTRKNFNEVIELIKRCNNNFNSDQIIVDKKAWTIEFPVTDTDMTPKRQTAKVGDYLARNVSGGWGEIHKYTAGEFRSKFTVKPEFRDLYWYTPTEIEYQVIQALQHDSDMCYSYDWIMDYTKVDRAETKVAVDHLRELNIVGFHRGLMTEDGEVAGSGFGINDRMQQLMAELLTRRYEERRIPELRKGETIGFKGFGENIDARTFKIVDIKGDVLQLEIIKDVTE